MGRIADIKSVIDYLKTRIDITKAMNDVVQLEKAGPDLHKAVCCFHEEKTPSLTVTPSKGLYHCFGCKASGDIVTFYKDHYHVNTVEAITMLAKKFDIDISKFERDLTPEEAEQYKLMGINEQVRDIMNSFVDQVGYYLGEGRGLDKDIIDKFGVGYSPDLSEVIGIADSNSVDRLELDKPAMWNNAIVYPMHDTYGRVIGFKNRPLDAIKGMKFVGTSSKSPLHREDHLYGFHIARKNATDGRLVGVEGQHDVLKMHQHGIDNTIGTDGTALNKAKIKLLEEHGIRELIVVYDGDNAGKEASIKIAKSSAELETTISIKIATMPDGLDPDEFLDKHGSMMMRKILSEAVYASQYLIDQIANEMSISTVTQKLDFIKRSQPVIMSTQSFEQKFLIAYVAEKVGIDESVIDDMLRAEQAKKSKSLLYNIEGEKIVLGGILRDEEFRDECLIDMIRDDWYQPKHQTLFEMIHEMAQSNMSISLETIKATMNNKGYNQIFQEGSFIDEIYANIGDYKTIKDDIIDKAIRRRLIRNAELLKSNAQDLKNRLVLVVEEHMNGVQSSMDSTTEEGTVDSKQGSTSFMNDLHNRMQSPDKIVGIDLGPKWTNVTNALNGIQNKKLITVSANQSVGKTTLVCNWLEEISVEQKKPWLHFSLEMPNEELIMKIIGIRAGVDSMRIQRGNLTSEEYSRVQQASIDYYNGNLILNDTVTTLEGIINETRRKVRSHNIVGVSIDYIQLMRIERSRNKQRYEELGDISGGLKTDLAKALNLPCIILSQLSKTALDHAVAKAEHGAGSYKIAQDSDVYITLKEKSEEEIEQWGIEKGNLVLNIDKNRGGTADILLDILFQKHIQVMQEIN